MLSNGEAAQNSGYALSLESDRLGLRPGPSTCQLCHINKLINLCDLQFPHQ